jgi:HD-GYP domain-containing protein (c-di-GMP phosphodiesterase class II)
MGSVLSASSKGLLSASERTQFATISTSQLRDGVTLRCPLFDSRCVLLLAAGVTITPAVLEKIAQRGITSVKVHYSELGRLSRSGGLGGKAPRSAGGDRLAATRHTPLEPKPNEYSLSERAPNSMPRKGAYVEKIERHGQRAYDNRQSQEASHAYQHSVDQIKTLFEKVTVIRASEIDTFEGVSSDSLAQIAGDIDLFVSVGTAPETDKYPARHSMQCSMLAMSIAANMGWDKRSLLELGIGCLAHDVGMLHINKRTFQTDVDLDPLSFLEITKHPGITFDLMRSVEHLAGCSRLVAYQMHERCNGTGYPRRRTRAQIHPLARIAAVADVFTALISARPHRDGMLPYYAMEHMIRGAKEGLFDPEVIRGLLHTVTLFPIGSYVKLNDGRLGQVLRANGTDYTKPILHAWHIENLGSEPEVLDLAQEVDLAVERPIATLEYLADPTDGEHFF